MCKCQIIFDLTRVPFHTKDILLCVGKWVTFLIYHFVESNFFDQTSSIAFKYTSVNKEQTLPGNVRPFLIVSQ